jgi:hypothetical protein
MRISVQRDDFDAGAEIRKLAGDGSVGAIASFVGLVRDVPMTLEHYAGMTEREITKIAHEAAQRWSVIDVTVIHRFGELSPPTRSSWWRSQPLIAARHSPPASSSWTTSRRARLLEERAPRRRGRVGRSQGFRRRGAERWTGTGKDPGATKGR